MDGEGVPERNECGVVGILNSLDIAHGNNRLGRQCVGGLEFHGREQLNGQQSPECLPGRLGWQNSRQLQLIYNVPCTHTLGQGTEDVVQDGEKEEEGTRSITLRVPGDIPNN